jgi:3-hydroxyacyl-[acyl-carrier-protein] dehydratase
MRLEYFQLIDRISEIDIGGQTIRAEATVPATSTIFEGHFPGYPLMPGVLLMEAMAQTSGWLIIALTGFTRMPFLAAFKEAKLRDFVTPGQALALTAAIVHEGSGYTITKAEIRSAARLVCDAQITFRLREFPSPEFRAGLEQIAQAIAFPQDTRHG